MCVSISCILMVGVHSLSSDIRIFLKVFFIKKSLFISKKKEGEQLKQEELRQIYCDRLKAEKQIYIAEQTGINPTILSQFKNGHLNLMPSQFDKLRNYLSKKS